MGISDMSKIEFSKLGKKYKSILKICTKNYYFCEILSQFHKFSSISRNFILTCFSFEYKKENPIKFSNFGILQKNEMLPISDIIFRKIYLFFLGSRNNLYI